MKENDPSRRRADREEHRAEGLDQEAVERSVCAERHQDPCPGQAEKQRRARIEATAPQKLAEVAESPARERDRETQEPDESEEHENPTRVPKAKRTEAQARLELCEKPEHGERGQRDVEEPRDRAAAAARTGAGPVARGSASHPAARG